MFRLHIYDAATSKVFIVGAAKSGINLIANDLGQRPDVRKPHASEEAAHFTICNKKDAKQQFCHRLFNDARLAGRQYKQFQKFPKTRFVKKK